MNPQISFDNLRSSIFEFRLRACVLLYFWHDLLVPKTLEAHLTSFTKNKEIGSTSASFREGPKMSKRQLVFPVELSKVLLIYGLHWRAAYNCESYKYRISEVKDLDNLRFSLAECTAQFHSSNA